MTDKKARKKVKSDEELLELGKKMQNFFDLGYVARKEAFIFSFLKGLAAGAGAFIGGTLIIALLLWALSLFDTLPIVSNLVNAIQQGLHK